MRAKVVKTGNSKAVIIPAALADELGLEVGSEVLLEKLPSGVFISRPSDSRRSPVAAAKRFVKKYEDLFKLLAAK